jgi:DNA-binding transcriptional MerR regulator
MIKIKDFSEQVGFSIRMLRYLEEVEVLVPKREENNYRVYSDDQIDVARKIKKLQVLGVQLKEVQILQTNKKDVQIETLENVLKREQEISELKSETIPELKNMIDLLKQDGESIGSFFENHKLESREINIIGNDEKFKRTAFSISILRNIYEDHLTNDANIDLIATDLIKFNMWFKNADYTPNTFSVLHGTAFVFGKNITNKFLIGYEVSWKKFLPEMGFVAMDDFCKEDIAQLMGPHDILIRTIFKYKDTNIDGEILIPYSPIYTMSQLSNKT